MAAFKFASQVSTPNQIRKRAFLNSIPFELVTNTLFLKTSVAPFSGS